MRPFINFASHIRQTLERCTYATEKNLFAIGIVGAVGFPLYYFIWAFVFPQSYENLPLRLIGCGLMIPLMLASYWPSRLKQKLLSTYWFISAVYALPFFFTYMTLMNDASAVWGMSTTAAIVLLFLLIDDWILLNVMFLIGTIAGWLMYAITTGNLSPPYAYLEQLPIYAFVLLAGSIFNSRKAWLIQERLRVMIAIGSNIAHELRTPLLGIRSGLVGLKRHLPALIEGYQIAVKHELVQQPIRASHLQSLEKLIHRLEDETKFSNSIIDILLMNSGNININHNEFKQYSITDSINTALERYPFQSQLERQQLTFKASQDFTYYGSEVLLTHVLFNLIKNSLESLHNAKKGQIYITTQCTENGNHVIFRDTGKGIDPFILPHIFKPFFTTGASGKGTGIGLSFCKEVMESFGGSITATSVANEYAEFKLTFKEVPNG